MNKKNTDRWELRLNAVHVIILLGLVTGSMTLAFYLGFFAGKDVGYELAMEQTATTVAKLPIMGGPSSPADAADIAEQAVSEVYAKLADQKQALPETTEIPALEAIKPIDSQSEDPLEVHGTDALFDERPLVGSPAPRESSSDDTVSNPRVLGDELPVAKPTDTPMSAPTPTATRPAATPTATPRAPTPTRTPAATLSPALSPAPVKAVVTASATTAAPSAIAPGWYAQVAAPTELSEARSVADKLRSNGFPVAIENADVRGERYYRILVGPEGNRKQAEALVQQLRREPYVTGAPFIRVIK